MASKPQPHYALRGRNPARGNDASADVDVSSTTPGAGNTGVTVPTASSVSMGAGGAANPVDPSFAQTKELSDSPAGSESGDESGSDGNADAVDANYVTSTTPPPKVKLEPPPVERKRQKFQRSFSLDSRSPI
ncbi:hypothetical protein BDN72DRAFT_845840 [Pluteus cervinus]|uniref:Uncharacterized protein n=1 Tax=Pluteus cervinus TaxID=181527 RepID=A0ACD3AHP9_9AGAR|nr:hypothetical protein BDN72DRAFT_845840 [Pluteus cervinus]